MPLRWSRSKNIRWQIAVPGVGHSSPLVFGDRVFLTTCLEREHDRLLLCFDRGTGKLLWQREVVRARLEHKHDLNSYASATPVTDGRRVWVSFLDDPHILVACYDVDGKLLWQRRPGEFHSIHGFCSSPILYKDLVILNGDQDGNGYLVALAQADGSERWRTARPNHTRSYCTPIVIEAAGKMQLVLSGSKCVAAYDPDSGRPLWIVDGPTEQFVAGLVYTRGVLFVTGGFPEFHIEGIRPDGHGNVTRTHVLWHDTRGAAYVPSPIAHGDDFFLVSDNGIGSCLRAASGQRMWMQRLGRHHSASPVSAGDYLFFVDDAGTTFVLKAAENYTLVSRNELGENCYASPAVAHGEIFIRTVHHLWCIATPAQASEDSSER